MANKRINDLPEATSTTVGDKLAVDGATTRSITVENFLADKRPNLGIDNVDNTSDADKPVSTDQAAAIAVVQDDIDAHEADTANPHSVTKTQVGLGNVDNTSDATKNAASATLTNKTLTSPVINTPTGIVKGDVGLGNVDNTSDATKNSATATLTGKTISGASNTLTVREADLSTSDVTTGNVSTTKHGFAPKLPNDATKFLNGAGAYSTPAGGGGGGGSVFWAEDFNVIADGTDMTSEIQAALGAIEPTGGILWLPPGHVVADGQLTYNGSSLTIMGSGMSRGSDIGGTVLDLKYASGPKFVFGDGTTRLNWIRFTNLHLTDFASTDQYMIYAPYIRGFCLDHVTFSNIYGMAIWGDASAAGASSYITMSDVEGNMRGTGHQHFFDFVRVEGPVLIGVNNSIEGADTVPAGSVCFNFGPSSMRIDGLEAVAGHYRQFSRIWNFECGCANVSITGGVFDEVLDYAVYADTDVGSINGLKVHNCRMNSDSTSTGIGIAIFQTTEPATGVSIQGNDCMEWGQNGIWVSGTMGAVVTGNMIRNCGQQTNNTYSSLRVGTGVSGIVCDNFGYTDATNKPKYHFLIDSTQSDLIVDNNRGSGSATASLKGFSAENTFSAHKNGTDQTGIVTGTFTKLTFGTEVFDNGDTYDAANSKWIPGPGVCHIMATAEVAAGVVDQQIYTIAVYKNGSLLKSGDAVPASGTSSVRVSANCLDFANSSDFYEIYFAGNGAGDKTVEGDAPKTYFQGHKL